MDFIITGINYVLDWINSIPAESWRALGAILAGSSLVAGGIAWYNRSRVKNGLDRLGRVLVTFNVAFWSAITTVLAFVITNGSTFAPFLPFFGTHWPQIIGIATVIYNISKPSLAWWKARKEGKPITNPNYTPPVVTESFGTAATGRTQTDPNLIQL
jgi:hypothetical protein